MSRNRLIAACAALVACVPMTASATPLTPLSYDMRNGDGAASGGSLNYWDLKYDGLGATTTDAAPLSGGKGDLTDGAAAADIWFPVENLAGTGPYVGWFIRKGADPVVTFSFAGNPTVETLRVHLDNTGIGGVAAPTDIRVNGSSVPFVAPAFGTAGWVEINGLSAVGGLLSLQFIHDRLFGWVFVSEVEFDGRNGGGAVPEPAALTLLLTGLGWLTIAARARGRSRR